MTIVFLLAMCWLWLALMSASEGALASTNRVRLRQWLRMHAPSSVVLRAPESDDDDPPEAGDAAQRFLATVTIAANVPLLLAAALSFELARTHFDNFFGLFGLCALSGFFTLVVFQIMPRLMARGGEESARWFPIMRFLVAILKPFVALLMFAGTALLRPLGLMKTRVVVRDQDDESDDGTDKILDLVESARDAGTLEESGRELIESIFTFGDTRVHEVMVPRPDIFALSSDSDTHRVLDALQSSGFSRVPIYEDDIDHIAGVLHIKDVLRTLSDGEKIEDRKSVV